MSLQLNKHVEYNLCYTVTYLRKVNSKRSINLERLTVICQFVISLYYFLALSNNSKFCFTFLPINLLVLNLNFDLYSDIELQRYRLFKSR